MTWKDRMYAGIGEYLRSIGFDVVQVDDIEECVESVLDRGGCDTCGHNYNVEFILTIDYVNSKGKINTYYYDGTFVNFINSIT